MSRTRQTQNNEQHSNFNYYFIKFAEDFLRSASSLIEIIKQKSCLLLDQLEANRAIEANKWNDIKMDIYEALQAQLKSMDLNINVYEEYGRRFQQQSSTIEAAYQEIRELVSNGRKYMRKLNLICFRKFDCFRPLCYSFCALLFALSIYKIHTVSASLHCRG